MPRHFGIRKRRERLEFRGKGSNIDKLSKDFEEQIQFGKAQDDPKMKPEDIKKKFSI